MEGVFKKLFVKHIGPIVAWLFDNVSGQTRERVVLWIGVFWLFLWSANAYFNIVVPTWPSFITGLVGYSASVSILAWTRSYNDNDHVNRDLVCENSTYVIIITPGHWKLIREYTVKALTKTSQSTHFSRPSAEVDINAKARNATLKVGKRRSRVIYKAQFNKTLEPGETYTYSIIENVIDERENLQTYYATKFDYFSNTKNISITIKFKNRPQHVDRYGEDRFTENYVIPKETAPLIEDLEDGEVYYTNNWIIENPMETCWYTFEWYWD